MEFLNRLQQYGEIRPDLVSDDFYFYEHILKHPLLLWRAKQVKEGD